MRLTPAKLSLNLFPLQEPGTIRDSTARRDDMVLDPEKARAEARAVTARLSRVTTLLSSDSAGTHSYCIDRW